jgi:hypothetical protein
LAFLHVEIHRRRDEDVHPGAKLDDAEALAHGNGIALSDVVLDPARDSPRDLFEHDLGPAGVP